MGVPGESKASGDVPRSDLAVDDTPARPFPPAWAHLDRAMPWLLAGFAVLFAAVAFGLMEPLRRSPPAVVGALFAAVALVWTGLAAAATVLALRHARAEPHRLLPRLAWCWVPVVFVVGLPFIVYMASDHMDGDYDPPRACIDSLLPASVSEALFDWTPMGPYPLAHVVVGVAGLAMIVPASTRRPAAWVLAGTLLNVSLLVGGAITSINQCD